MISILGDDDPDIVICVNDFGEITGTIESKPELLPECKNPDPIDPARAWTELQRSCRG